MSRLFRFIDSRLAVFALALCALVGYTSCSEQDEELVVEYGYVQFKLYKNDTAPAQSVSRASTLEYLSDAHKVKVTMQHEGSTIEQTLVLNSYNADNAEYGLRSDKLQLLAGEYHVIAYTLYNRLDEEIMVANCASQFVIVPDGLIYHNLSVDVTPRGKATFQLVKEFVTRGATEGAYPFSKIKAVSFTVKNVNTQETASIEKLPIKLEPGFQEGTADEELYPGLNAQITYATIDTVVWLKAGTYTVSGYTTYSDKNARVVLEATTNLEGVPFVVEDNKLTENVPVAIRLSETAEHIKDYIALKEIWLALDGPNWSYYGEAEAAGCNWDFNKELDLWGDQPGIGLDNDGRVTSLSLAGMGARGVVPDAIGQLDQLAVLSLGTHDELLGGHLFEDANAAMSAERKHAIRMDYHTKFLKRDIREGLSDILQEGINRDDKQEPILKSTRISTKDVQFGNLTNQITGISRAMMRLTELQQFYLANSPITAENFFVDVQEDSPFYAEKDSWSWENLTALTDVEIYNCPNLTSLPLELLTQIPEIQLLNIACNTNISAEQLKSDWEAIIEGNSGDRIQILYMGYNNLKEFPTHEYLSKMSKLAMLDCTNNQIETLHPFGKEISLIMCYLDYNKITHIPTDEEGYFFGYSDVEEITCTHNLLTEVPDIFNAKSVNVMKSVDFSYNQIAGFENGDNHRGINAASVSLSCNRFETMPAQLFKSGSPISTLILSGNGMKSIPEGSMTGKFSHFLQTLDLSYNKLSDLPSDLWSTNVPYLYGIDVSYNCFSEFPVEPLDGAYLTTYGIRHQRDEEGNRTLKEWPTGLYTCPSLMAFYIGSNDLRKIEDTISPYIRYFEIKDNPNISIDLSSVCDYIAAGYYLLIYDKTQDIRGCDYLDLE